MYNDRVKKYDEAMQKLKQWKYKEAEIIFLEILDVNRKNKYVLFQMGKIRLKFRDKKGAEEYFKECIEYFPNDIYSRLELGKLYSIQGKEKEAEKELKKCIEIDKDKTPHARLELGRLYRSQRKEKEAEKEFKKYIEIDKDKTPHARLELGRLYSIQGKEKEAEYMYNYILSNLDYDITDTESRIKHIQKHMKNDTTKDLHGVFTMDALEILDTAIKNKGEKQIGYMCDIYCINVPNCGYEGGKNGDGHILNYVTFITLPNSNDMLTMFPSDEIVLNREKKESLDVTNSFNLEER